MPAFEGKPGEVKGLIVASVARRFAHAEIRRRRGARSASWGLTTCSGIRAGLPPPKPRSPGLSPEMGAIRQRKVGGTEHLSSVKEEHLRAIARKTGLAYAYLDGADPLSGCVRGRGSSAPVVVATDIRALPGRARPFLLLVLFGVLPLRRALARGGCARPPMPRFQHPVTLKEAHI